MHVSHHASGQHYDAELNKYPYMNTRNKSYPWSCPDCGLFNQKWYVNTIKYLWGHKLISPDECLGWTVGMNARDVAEDIIRFGISMNQQSILLSA